MVSEDDIEGDVDKPNQGLRERGALKRVYGMAAGAGSSGAMPVAPRPPDKKL